MNPWTREIDVKRSRDPGIEEFFDKKAKESFTRLKNKNLQNIIIKIIETDYIEIKIIILKFIIASKRGLKQF